MASHRSYELRFRDSQGSFKALTSDRPTSGFIEGQPAVLVADVPRNSGIELFIASHKHIGALPRWGWKIDPTSADKQESRWEWTPSHHGKTVAMLVDTEGKTRREFHLNVDQGQSRIDLHCEEQKGEQDKKYDRDKFPLISDPRVTNCGFSENPKHEMVFVADRDAGPQMFVDGEQLEEDGNARWKWKPGLYAGEVRAELREDTGDKGSRRVFRLDVSPDPDKLGEGNRVFKKMLGDILDISPDLLIGYEPAQIQLGAVGTNDDPLVQFMRLLSQRQEIDRALTVIQRDPASVVRPRRRFVPLRETRRADRRTLRSALRNPATLAVFRREASASCEVPGPEPFFDTPAVERRLDSPANRTALAMLRMLRLRCDILRPQLKKIREKQGAGETRTPLGPRREEWKKSLINMEHGFRAAERQKPFSEVERPEITAAGLNAIAADPRYARFWRVAWAALRKRGDQEHPEAMLSLPPTWEIYESWCFSWLARSLAEWLGFKWNPLRHTNNEETRPGCRQLVSKDYGKATLTLELQSKFVAFKNYWNQPRDTGWSVSSKRYPDIVLRSQGRNPWFMVFDVKYRAEDQLLGSVGDTVHKYQDGLRWGKERMRPVATLILAPNSDAVKDLENKGKDVPWLTNEKFVKEHCIGVVTLRPPGISPHPSPPEWFRSLLTSENPTEWFDRPCPDSQA